MASVSTTPFFVNTIQLPCNSPLYFCQLQVQENFNCSCELTDTVAITLPKLNIYKVRLVDTMMGTSAEGQHLTGKKLVIIGVLDAKIVITRHGYACQENCTKVVKACPGCGYQENRVIDKTLPFSSYIVIPLQVCNSKHISIGYDIEDYSANILNRNHLFLSISLMLTYNDYET